MVNVQTIKSLIKKQDYLINQLNKIESILIENSFSRDKKTIFDTEDYDKMEEEIVNIRDGIESLDIPLNNLINEGGKNV